MNVSPRLMPWAGFSTVCRPCQIRIHRQQFRRAATAAAAASRDAPSHAQSSHPPPSFNTQRPPNTLRNGAGQWADNPVDALPRWARTPPAMKAPHAARPKNDNDDYPCNEDPMKLDEMYVKLLGMDGDKMLSEEVKWLAVTHKSFDHGRRGFNERLTFLGRRIIDLQTSLALLDAPQSEKQMKARSLPDHYGRRSFEHSSLNNLENIQVPTKDAILDKKRMAQLAQRYGVADVVRWKPRQILDLQTSGIDSVLKDTIYAIIGALALEKGGDVANQAVRQRILQPLGLT